MALATYFNRTATAASQVLQSFDTKEFGRLLDGLVIGIAFDEQACSTEGRASLDLLVRLMARFYPTIRFLPMGDQAKRLARSLAALARSINKQITIAPRASPLTHCLVVGSSVPDDPATKLFLGSDGWIARFSSEQLVGCGRSDNVFGAGAAACIAVSNLFRMIFGAQLSGASVDTDVSFSLFDHRTGSSANPPLEEVALDDLYLLGLGAIGNGALWALSNVPRLHGQLILVDDEAIDQGNLQRYVLTRERDVGSSKTKLARRHLKHRPDLLVEEHGARWQTLPAGSMTRVAIALDTPADRIAVQASLPQWTINSWTQRGDLGVSHHGFDGDMACLACLYLPSGAVRDEDDVIAEALGLQDQKRDLVRVMLHNGAPVGEALMSEIAGRLGIPVEPLLPFVGQPLRNLYQGAICGGVVFELSGGAKPVRVEVPMAFQSAMAGVMLAAEIVKRATNGPPEWTTAKVNLLRKMPSDVITERRKKDRLNRCICQDADYLEAYREKYRTSDV